MLFNLHVYYKYCGRQNIRESRKRTAEGNKSGEYEEDIISSKL